MYAPLVAEFENEHDLIENEDDFRKENVSFSLMVRAMQAPPSELSGIVTALVVTQPRRVFRIMFHVIMNITRRKEFHFRIDPIDVCVGVFHMILTQRWAPTIHSFMEGGEARAAFFPFGRKHHGKFFFFIMERYGYRLMLDSRLFILIPILSHHMICKTTKYGWVERSGHVALEESNAIFDKYRKSFAFAFFAEFLLLEKNHRREMFEGLDGIVKAIGEDRKLIYAFHSLGDSLNNDLGKKVIEMYNTLY